MPEEENEKNEIEEDDCEFVKVTAKIAITAEIVEPVDPVDDGKFHYEFETYEIQTAIDHMFHDYWPEVTYDVDLTVDVEEFDEEKEEEVKQTSNATIDVDDFHELIQDKVALAAQDCCGQWMEWFGEEDGEDGWYENMKDLFQAFGRIVAHKLGFIIEIDPAFVHNIERISEEEDANETH
jgi:hypothetical protein